MEEISKVVARIVARLAAGGRGITEASLLAGWRIGNNPENEKSPRRQRKAGMPAGQLGAKAPSGEEASPAAHITPGGERDGCTAHRAAMGWGGPASRAPSPVCDADPNGSGRLAEIGSSTSRTHKRRQHAISRGMVGMCGQEAFEAPAVLGWDHGRQLCIWAPYLDAHAKSVTNVPDGLDYKSDTGALYSLADTANMNRQNVPYAAVWPTISIWPKRCHHPFVRNDEAGRKSFNNEGLSRRQFRRLISIDQFEPVHIQDHCVPLTKNTVSLSRTATDTISNAGRDNRDVSTVGTQQDPPC